MVAQRRIVVTRFDGGVSIVTPTREVISWLCRGGYWGNCTRGFLDEQLRRNVANGRNERASWRMIQALQWGGCTEAEAFDIVRDRDCTHIGTAHELTADVPADRWFRDAWRRSHNGGPIYVDLRAARRIQLARIKAAVARYNEPRLVLGRRPLALRWGEIGNAIRHARDKDELRRVWPASRGMTDA